MSGLTNEGWKSIDHRVLGKHIATLPGAVVSEKLRAPAEIELTIARVSGGGA